MLLDIIKGFLIGICASAPLGPIAIYVIRKSLGDGHRTFIYIAGGSVVTLLGVSMTFRDPFRGLAQDDAPSYSAKDFLKAAAMGLSNPGAILVIFALFAFFGIALLAEGLIQILFK